jgi:zinc transport system permease protein
MSTVLTEPFFQRALLAGLAVALVSGPVGCFIVWRRMAYFGESLAHSGLLGVGLGLLLNFSITLGAIATASVLALLLLALRRQKGLATDTLLGVLSHTALASGLIVVGLATGAASDHMDILFGDVLTVSTQDVIAVWVGAGLVLVSLSLMWRGLIATSVHEELARAEGVKVEQIELGFILLIAVMTAIAMKIVGLLLITALMVIPAAAARRLASTPERMAFIAATIAGLSVIGGLLASAFIGGASGPCVVLAASSFFALTLCVPQAS